MDSRRNDCQRWPGDKRGDTDWVEGTGWPECSLSDPGVRGTRRAVDADSVLAVVVRVVGTRSGPGEIVVFGVTDDDGVCTGMRASCLCIATVLAAVWCG